MDPLGKGNSQDFTFLFRFRKLCRDINIRQQISKRISKILVEIQKDIKSLKITKDKGALSLGSYSQNKTRIEGLTTVVGQVNLKRK